MSGNKQFTNVQSLQSFQPPALVSYSWLCKTQRGQNRFKGWDFPLTLGKYSLPWFPCRKQDCKVSDDPGFKDEDNKQEVAQQQAASHNNQDKKKHTSNH